MANPEWIAIITAGARCRRRSTAIPVSRAAPNSNADVVPNDPTPGGDTARRSAQNQQQNAKADRADDPVQQSDHGGRADAPVRCAQMPQGQTGSHRDGNCQQGNRNEHGGHATTPRPRRRSISSRL